VAAERIAEYRRAYHEANAERRHENNRRWRERNKDSVAAAKRRWADENADSLRTYYRHWNRANTDRVREKRERWERANPHKALARAALRRARKQRAVSKLTPSQKAAIDHIYEMAARAETVCCYLCGRSIPKGQRHVDHVVPLSREGAHAPSNLAIACAACNLSKGSKLPEEVGADV